jgi:3-oxoadipate enol-lactonase
MNEKHANLNGVDLVWAEKGNGAPLLLLHGFPLNRSMWEPQINFFADYYRVIAPDLRGFGKTALAQNNVNTMELFAEDIAALLDYCGVEKAHVMGLSMGGYISFALYRQFPQKVKSLILADTKAEGDTPEVRKGRYELAEKVKIEGSKAATDGMLPKMFAPANNARMPQVVAIVEAMINHTNPNTIIATLPGLAERLDSTETLRQIQVPTLVIHGIEDVLMPVAKAEAMTAHIPNAQFVVVPEAGHLSNLENPAFFNQQVLDFLKNDP